MGYSSFGCKEPDTSEQLSKHTEHLYISTRLCHQLHHKKKCKKAKWFSEEALKITEAEEIKKRWQEYTEKLYKKGLNDPDNHDGMVTYLEPDILSVKSSGPQDA